MTSHTIGALYREGAALLSAAGVEEPEFDARALLAHVLDLGPNDILLHQTEMAEEDTERVYSHLLQLRSCRVPLQYVTRTTYFCNLKLRTDDRALIPRPETEQLVEAVVERLQPLQPGAVDAIVDLGCGSGAIGLCLATQLPLVHVIMTDVSAAALELTAENVHHNGLDERVTLLQGAYLDPVHAAGMTERVVAVVCNPPYVRPDEMPALAPELLAEPRSALESPAADGLEAYRVLAAQAADLPRLRLLAFEVGFEQAAQVGALMASLGKVEILPDLAGIDRIVIVHVH